VQLRTYLKRLRLPPGSAIPSNATSQTVKPLTIDAYLAQLVKQSYLDKQKTSLASTQGGQKRARGGGAVGGGDDGDASFEWKWGTRAIAEIGEEGVGGFVVDFMDGIERERENRRAEEDGVRESTKKEKESTGKRKEKLLIAIGRAAGGGLVPFK
jgi:melanoma-associated antigen